MKQETAELLKKNDIPIRYDKNGNVCIIKGPIESKEEIIESILEDIIHTIEKELKDSFSTSYECEDGTAIGTDVGYIEEWFNKYKNKLRLKYCENVYKIKREDQNLYLDSYFRDLNNRIISELFDNNALYCELFSDRDTRDKNQILEINMPNVCAKVLDFEDDYIIIELLENNSNSNILKEFLDSKPDSIEARLRFIDDGFNRGRIVQIKKAITFDLIYKGE